MPEINIIHGDAIEVLPTMDPQSVQTVVTSPPYFGLRDYGLPPTSWPAVSYAPIAGMAEVEIPAWDGCLGLEPTPAMFIGHLITVFREVWRVLRDDGTVWLNMGDSYAANRGSGSKSVGKKQSTNQGALLESLKAPEGIPPKNLLMVPARLALALQADGWYLRSDIIWAKKNSMPESVTDRPTKSHEHIFLLAKSERYYYDADAIRTPYKPVSEKRVKSGWNGEKQRGQIGSHHNNFDRYMGTAAGLKALQRGSNRRDVWSMATQPFKEAHFAVFPPAIPELCIKAGSAVDDTVLDPFSGAGTTGLMAIKRGRDYVGIEKSEEYVEMSRTRLAKPVQMVLV